MSLLLDDDDLECYESWLNAELPNEAAFTGSWDNYYEDFKKDEHDPTLEYLDNFNDELLKMSPSSSDSGNHSPTDAYNKQYYHTASSMAEAFSDSHVGQSAYISANEAAGEAITSPLSQNPFQFSTSNVLLAKPIERITLVPVSKTNSGTLVISHPVNMHSGSLVAGSMVASPNDEQVAFKQKMEDRRLRNRAAAQASRQRKRIMMDEMKLKLDESLRECDRLRTENEILRAKLMLIENQNDHTKAKKAKAATGICLAVCALVFTFYGSQGNRYASPSTDMQISPEYPMIDNALYTKRHGRVLAEMPDYDNDNITNNSTDRAVPKCPINLLNSTEKIRLNNEINNWVAYYTNVGDLANKRPLRISESTEVLAISREEKRNRRLENRNQRFLKKPEKLENKSKKILLENRTDLPVINRKHTGLANELSKMIKEDGKDVLYFVVMKDYHLLPLGHRNFSNPPKISIIIPALTVTNVTKPNQRSMMKIDCTVTEAGLFNIPKELENIFN